MARLLLDVPYLSQIDSETSQGSRMCFSSTCAMLLNFLKPLASVFDKDTQKDDAYLLAVNNAGYDSTDPMAHIHMLTKYGIVCRFIKNGNWVLVNSLLKKGYPVPVGWLHKGPEYSPQGGGHWSLIVGHNEDRSVYFVNDPYGEIDLKNGKYGKTNGKMVKYSRQSFQKRWMVEGDKTGWMIEVLDVKS